MPELPDDLQDQLATEVIEEIEGESRWDQTLAHSPGKLERLACLSISSDIDLEAGVITSSGSRWWMIMIIRMHDRLGVVTLNWR